MNDMFKLRDEQTYNLYKICQFYRQKVNSVYNGTKIVSFLGPIKWELKGTLMQIWKSPYIFKFI